MAKLTPDQVAKVTKHLCEFGFIYFAGKVGGRNAALAAACFLLYHKIATYNLFQQLTQPNEDATKVLQDLMKGFPQP
jgi:hypothetical protein